MTKLTKLAVIYILLMIALSAGYSSILAAPPRPGDERPPRPKPGTPVPGGNTERHADELLSPYRIEGIVSNAATNKAGAGLYVRINDTLVRTDTQGHYSLTGAGLQPGTYTLSLALPEGLKPLRAPQTVVLGPEKQVEINLQYLPDFLNLQLKAARKTLKQRRDIFKGLKQQVEEAERRLQQAQLELNRLEAKAGLPLSHPISDVIAIAPAQTALTLPPPSPPATLLPALPARGGYFGVSVPNAQKDCWTVVQWQDSNGNWRNIDSWQGELDERNQKLWWVAEDNFGQGPFRWMVYENRTGAALALSSPFYLPASAEQSIMIELR